MVGLCFKKHWAPDSRIKAMVRWMSDEALHIYARDNRAVYAVWLRKAMDADVDSIQVRNLPDIDPHRIYERIQHALDAEVDGS